MRCYEFRVDRTEDIGKVTPGIKTNINKENERFVSLGMRGPGCRNISIFFDYETEDDKPYIDDTEMLHLAYPITKSIERINNSTGKTYSKLIPYLKKAYRSPTKILLRINTYTTNSYNINGRWLIKNGKPGMVVRAHGQSYGQRWADDLITMDDMDVILVYPAGGGRKDRMIIRNDKGKISCIPELDYDKILADHKKDMLLIKSKKSPVLENVAYISKKEIPVVLNNKIEEKSQDPENIKTPSIIEKVEIFETPQADREIIIHTESGETIGV